MVTVIFRRFIDFTENFSFSLGMNVPERKADVAWSIVTAKFNKTGTARDQNSQKSMSKPSHSLKARNWPYVYNQLRLGTTGARTQPGQRLFCGVKRLYTRRVKGITGIKFNAFSHVSDQRFIDGPYARGFDSFTYEEA